MLSYLFLRTSKSVFFSWRSFDIFSFSPMSYEFCLRMISILFSISPILMHLDLSLEFSSCSA